LHLRSGVPEDKLAELHGDCFKEVCKTCGKIYLRKFDVYKTVDNPKTHITGRKCTSCKGPLLDTIINFGENLPQKELSNSIKETKNADIAMVCGTSMRVQPACNIPLNAKNLIIVNLQKTLFDKKCKFRIFSKTDKFFGYLCEYLNLKINCDIDAFELPEK
jgi:NAD-dependent SIR2 family protein deacetylase